jgi:hypothetical protein
LRLIGGLDKKVEGLGRGCDGSFNGRMRKRSAFDREGLKVVFGGG